MELLINRVLKKLVDNRGAVLMNDLFSDIHSTKNKEAFQKMIDNKYIEFSIDPLQSFCMVVELTMTGYDAYINENIKCSTESRDN